MLDQKRTDPSSPWISRFDEGSLASEAARSLRQLGQFQSAARQARRIIEIRPDSHARSRAFGHLLLANILVSQGEPDEACMAGHEALDASRSISSYLVVQQLRKLAKRLEPFQASRVATEYLVAVDDVLRERVRSYSWLAVEMSPPEVSGSLSGG